ncbi:MAG: HAMP domain-containing sensor histidine kinase [Pseudomonadota bacterium]
MKLSSLQTRILVSAVATSLVALLLVWLTSSAAMRRFSGELGARDVALQDVEICERAPEIWRKELGGFLSIFAYDGETRRSLNPEAPPLDPELGAQAAERGVLVGRSEGRGRIAVVRMAASGPCALFQTRIQPPPEQFFHEHLATIALSGVLAIMAVAGLTLLLAVRPIVRRVRRLRDAAGQVGQEGYRSAEDATGDEISRIGVVLDESHARIVADRAELRARHEALERHLAEIAHDLRTPLASLLLCTEELSEAGAEGAPEVAARALEDTVYLEALVDNLRQATLLRHGLDPRSGAARTDLGDVVRRVGQRFAALGRRRGVEVVWAVPDALVPVRCPPALAERALANLVHNAVVHGAAGGHVAVVLEVAAARFNLTVLDDGSGVDEEILADLAARTFRVDAARTRGQGLGLAITNEVCQRAGWAIRYERPAEGGLRVVIEGAFLAAGGGTGGLC